MAHEFLDPPPTFAALEPERSALEHSRVVVLPAPFDGTVSYGTGTRNGPAAILHASTYVELYDDVLAREPADAGIHTLPPLAIVNDAAAMVDRVRTAVHACLEQDKAVVMLGGEHSLSSGAVAAYAARYPELSVLQIDAHADFRDSYEGNPHSHACAGRRMAEHAPLVQVAVRSACAEDMTALASAGVTTVWARDIATAADDTWMDTVVNALSGPVYVTIDLDGLDPGIMPAVGTPEPGGLDWWTTLRLLGRVAAAHRIIGADVMELAPIAGQSAPDFLAAKLTYHLIGLVAAPT